MKLMAMSHPQTIPGVPAYPIPYHSVEANDGRSPRTAKETQKEVHRENSRLNSGLRWCQLSRLPLRIVVLLVTKRCKSRFIGIQFSFKHWYFVRGQHRCHLVLCYRSAMRRPDAGLSDFLVHGVDLGGECYRRYRRAARVVLMEQGMGYLVATRAICSQRSEEGA